MTDIEENLLLEWHGISKSRVNIVQFVTSMVGNL